MKWLESHCVRMSRDSVEYRSKVQNLLGKFTSFQYNQNGLIASFGKTVVTLLDGTKYLLLISTLPCFLSLLWMLKWLFFIFFNSLFACLQYLQHILFEGSYIDAFLCRYTHTHYERLRSILKLPLNSHQCNGRGGGQ